MKRILFLALLVLTATQLFAYELPEHLKAVSKEHIANTPSCETIVYNGKEYIKSYEYHNNFENYISTIYPKGEAEVVDSLNKIIIEQNIATEKKLGKKHYSPAVISIENFDKVIRYIKKSFKRKELKALTKGETKMVFRLNIIANSQKEILHFAVSYVSDNPDMDYKIIEFQERLRNVIELFFSDKKMYAPMTEDDLFNMRAALILGEKSKQMGVKAPDPSKFVTIIPPANTMGYDYYTNPSSIRLDNIYRKR